MFKVLSGLIFIASLFSSLEAKPIVDSQPLSEQVAEDAQQEVAFTVAYPEYIYRRPSHIPPVLWNIVKPYLLPSNHPVKYALDKIFSTSRVCLNHRNVAAAGFRNSHPRPYSKTVVSTHPQIPGYLVKMFLDDQKGVEDYFQWIKRIDGANAVSSVIQEYKFDNMFKVPKKWIYVMPAHPAPPNGVERKNFVLVVEDMHLVSPDNNTRRWQNQMTRERIDAYYVICHKCGLKDSIYPFNVPFCKDNKQAFIDLEYNHSWPIPFDITFPYFSAPMRDYWRSILENGGPAAYPNITRHPKKEIHTPKSVMKAEKRKKKAELRMQRKMKKRQVKTTKTRRSKHRRHHHLMGVEEEVKIDG